MPQDGIDRNLLQRQQQLQEFDKKLQDTARNIVPGSLAPPPARAGELPRVTQLPPAQLTAPQLVPFDVYSQQLHDSQLRRQLEQQTQNQSLPPNIREQQNQVQLLQFQREDQAHQLQQGIQRDSSRAMQGIH
jgi:hypothetical protein